jgi:hypothetical protein
MVQGSRFRVPGSGFIGSKLRGSRFWVLGSGFRGSGFRGSRFYGSVLPFDVSIQSDQRKETLKKRISNIK